ncbi:MAG: discoidin domain-containing protein, partial [Microbacterium sp.]|nr:discoidin domain-containing protein [Microbacterium sp.]
MRKNAQSASPGRTPHSSIDEAPEASVLDIPLSRRQALQVGGFAALAAMAPTFLTARPASAAMGAPHSAASVAGSLARPQLSPYALWYGTPATDWESQALPIGNARLGAKLFGDPVADVVQFNEQSMWGGVNDYDNALAGQGDGAYDTSVTGFGSYRDFGTVTVSFGGRTAVTSPGGPYKTSGSEGVDRSYDGDSRTKWCIDGPPAQVLWQAELASAAEVSSYSLTSANDVPDRDPQQWSFQGSTDGSSWTTLDSRTGAPFESRFQTKSYTVATPGSYRFYRFVFVPKAGVSHFQLSEIGLAGVALAGGDGWYVSSPSGHADSLLGSVDGDAGTVWQADGAGVGATWQLESAAKKAFTGYAITSAADAGHDPRDWTVAGSDDGLTWTTLHQATGETFAERGQTRIFAFANTKAYGLYRIVFTGPAAFRVAGIAFTAGAFSTSGARTVVDYRRALDIAYGTYSTHFATT